MLSNDALVKIENAFSGLDTAIIASHKQNKKRIPTGRRYSEEVKRFALTIHFYSPKAYKYLRTAFSPPHGSSLYNWSSSVQRDTVFLRMYKQKIDADILNADCNLVRSSRQAQLIIRPQGILKALLI